MHGPGDDGTNERVVPLPDSVRRVTRSGPRASTASRRHRDLDVGPRTDGSDASPYKCRAARIPCTLPVAGIPQLGGRQKKRSRIAAIGERPPGVSDRSRWTETGVAAVRDSSNRASCMSCNVSEAARWT